MGPFLLESDLKLENLLFDSQTTADTGQVNFAETARAGSGKNVIQHEVKFIVTSSGNLTPTWKLSRVWSVNQSGVFLAALRNRTQDLLITLGQTDQTGTTLGPAAADIALSSQIGIAVSNRSENHYSAVRTIKGKFHGKPAERRAPGRYPPIPMRAHG